MSLVVRRDKEFTTVRRDNDGWLLGSVHRSRVLDGWSVIVVCPLGVRDGQLYQTEADAVAAIGRHQFTVVRTVAKLHNGVKHKERVQLGDVTYIGGSRSVPVRKIKGFYPERTGVTLQRRPLPARPGD